ncbi:MAG: haloacid dehalogenase type II [Deltaproteobacteria bacterium]|nr:haloacid dehalogenase type II [Deltaproteobacteria bacterium]
MKQKADLSSVKALAFDVFGTVVDWRTTIIRECTLLGKSKGIDLDWAEFADAWRGGYAPAMNKVRNGELPWMNIDAIHRMILDELVVDFDIEGLSEREKDELNRVWHRLKPWPDAVRGLRRLRRRFVLATLSNGNVSLLVNMAKNAGLPWDCILSSELAKHYKPDKEVYQTAAELLGLKPEQIMMVAAHKDDLYAARTVGFKTAFVLRPLEFGPEGTPDLTSDPSFDVTAEDFINLADKLGA